MDIIKIGRAYRCASPRIVPETGQVNDRIVIRVNLKGGCVQYDGPAVRPGRKYPTCTLKAFQSWAHADVTELLAGGWQRAFDPAPPQEGRTVAVRKTASLGWTTCQLSAKDFS
jgi:hypothetical protein